MPWMDDKELKIQRISVERGFQSELDRESCIRIKSSLNHRIFHEAARVSWLLLQHIYALRFGLNPRQ